MAFAHGRWKKLNGHQLFWKLSRSCLSFHNFSELGESLWGVSAFVLVTCTKCENIRIVVSLVALPWTRDFVLFLSEVSPGNQIETQCRERGEGQQSRQVADG